MDTQQSQGQSVPPQGAPIETVHGPKQNTLMGILSYIGILALIPFFTAKEDPFVKFHVKQGLVLLVIEVVVWLLGTMAWQLYMVLNLLNLVLVVFSIIGIINVVQGKQKELPLVGGFSKYFTF